MSSASNASLPPLLAAADGGECGIPYERLFAMPSTNHIRQWSSYNVGPVHILMLCSGEAHATRTKIHCRGGLAADG